jgi:hypothetical protein
MSDKFGSAIIIYTLSRMEANRQQEYHSQQQREASDQDKVNDLLAMERIYSGLRWSNPPTLANAYTATVGRESLNVLKLTHEHLYRTENKLVARKIEQIVQAWENHCLPQVPPETKESIRALALLSIRGRFWRQNAYDQVQKTIESPYGPLPGLILLKIPGTVIAALLAGIILTGKGGVERFQWIFFISLALGWSYCLWKIVKIIGTGHRIKAQNHTRAVAIVDEFNNNLRWAQQYAAQIGVRGDFPNPL